ncbi:hypothetical protein COW81_01150 [Candidatus Campbellbacteria bacterium CG22_combo_CG10-13_8_21_14_all_36_13]|uniref:Uncharacterized protein n=1 Tax=Candidatus Campbellbacteria bacterium CG22_combo_CG10-13_8_21_14_all_36_13 TaxID=1974529 RepID=A0A2H0DYJ5_9BACT|nr:MAG: hypothetical protein COW81_01150 [Candidatus Campbellbacteria bacterium CG22_combo_CG10-13_8_21_14_all_36_13]
MRYSLIINILLVLLLILVGVFIFNIPREEKIPKQDFYIGSINVDVSFEEGSYEYSGIISLPTPCYSLTTEAIVRESYPEQVTLLFATEDNSNGGMCAEVIKDVPFRIIFDASEDAIINAVFNGHDIDIINNKELIADDVVASTTEEFVN